MGEIQGVKTVDKAKVCANLWQYFACGHLYLIIPLAP